MKYLFNYSLLVLLFSFTGYTQTLPINRATDWTAAKAIEIDTSDWVTIYMENEGVTGDGITPNDEILRNIIAGINETGAVIIFPRGQFLFNQTIKLPSNLFLKGSGAEATTFIMNLEGFGNSIEATGTLGNTTTAISQNVIKDSHSIEVEESTSFEANDWIRIIQDDADLITSSWAEHSVGQIIQISSVNGTTLQLKSALRLDIDLSKSPYIRKINPIENVGISCLKLKRIDNTAPQQTNAIYFRYAVHSTVNSIESENCTYSHIKVESSSNIYIHKSYFHHAFEYGGGGRGYGVVLDFTTGECLVEDNIFKHLRHSMLLQAGANGNVFAYNYSYDPFWSEGVLPANSAGDMVLHGNYPFLNLFEHNICQNIVIDNSHGPNGPHNTFLRNRADSYGIFFSANNSPNQNFLGNDVTNKNLPYSLVNYVISGTGHFIFGNNNKGNIVPAGTNDLPDESYVYNAIPNFLNPNYFASIGTPNSLTDAMIPAKERVNNNDLFTGSCGNTDPTLGIFDGQQTIEKILIYPNPAHGNVKIYGVDHSDLLQIYNVNGVLIDKYNNATNRIDVSNLSPGTYFIIAYENNTFKRGQFLKL